MHPELMFMQDVKVLYNSILSDESSSVNRKIQVLKNMQTYLQEEDSRMQEADRECEGSLNLIHSENVIHVRHFCSDHSVFYLGKNKSKQEDLKEMGDISSGMSSSIMQIYLKQVLESFFHTQSTVRHFALSVITLTLSQGLIHPVQVRSHLPVSLHRHEIVHVHISFPDLNDSILLYQCVPYLIAMGTDPEPTMKNKADQQLVDIDKKYSGFIHVSDCFVQNVSSNFNLLD